MLDDAALFGLEVEPDDLEAPGDGVWPANVAAVAAFLRIATQWRAIGGMGMIWLGLDYGAALAGLQAAGIAVTPDLWADVQVIEAGALAALNEDRR